MQTGNLNGQGVAELQNYKLQNLASAPTTNLAAGRFYFSTADATLYVYNGTTWLDALAQGTTYTFTDGLTLDGSTVSVDFNSVATASQGALADSALQPNDNISELNNDAGYITGITSTDVTTALGYTPYNSTNPNGYITSAALSGYVPTSRTINGNALTANITLTASDVGALASTTTINDLTTTAQQNALNSGATTTNIGQIATNTSAISTINGKIPSQASSSNQLADKAFVNSTVQTNTANFRGNWATWAAVPSNANDYPADYAGSKTPTVNDYLVVEDASGYTGETLIGTWRFKYSGVWATDGKSGWLPEYQVNETPLTAAQLAALNSGITDTLVGQITTNANNISSLQSTAITASSTNTLTNKTIDADNNTISDLTTSNLKSGVLQTTIRATSSASDSAIPSEKAVASALANKLKQYTEINSQLTPSGGVCTWTIAHTDSSKVPIVFIFNHNTGEQVLPNNIILGSGTITIELLSTSNITAGTYQAVIIR